ncbi:16S rRNA (guanine(966)-N(2))-methyltransferase RsmD [Moraxella nasovis]|uniref:16S rRNA (guanine(966)-N(2))-methyltransferase RsmD n=1 Tax=Moraxella nasovis TaxID=2904121 RepID=UPI001F610A89|nr:16S rRNA (guanine(966)-N(2))-methyltransferase RsmD [Moraxella nasovis]UNU73082.1 16S rRNA (guanine(966)-N(2))-methyltransferase RsmD [Moraxella nasovis]
MSKTTIRPKSRPKSNLALCSSVRIIGGQFKRRQISFIDADGLRPTPDRLRETLFNWLMADIHDAVVLDVCAGSGVLGFESLSRGASFVTFIEPNIAQASQLKRTSDTLKLTKTQVSIFNATAQDTLAKLNTAFDVIFIDPPYALNLWQTILQMIDTHQLYHADTLLYIESDTPLDALLSDLKITALKSVKVGQVFAYLAQFSPISTI